MPVGLLSNRFSVIYKQNAEETRLHKSLKNSKANRSAVLNNYLNEKFQV